MSSPPTKYERQASFTDFSANHPEDQQPGIDLDAEFDGIKATTDHTIDRLNQLQRSDGALANQIVTPDSLSAATRALMAGTGVPRGDWATGTQYAAKDLTTEDGSVYIAVSAHLSGVFADDLAAGKWMIFSAAADATAIDGAVADAAAASAAAATALATAEGVMPFVVGAGSANAITGAFTPAITSLTDGLRVRVRALLANTTTTPTFKADATAARTITKLGGAALVVGDIAGPLHELDLSYNLANTRWELMNPALPMGGTTGTGALVKKSVTDALAGGLGDLSGVSDAPTARTHLGLHNGATTVITIQNGGSPPGGAADGDLCFIW